MYTRYSVGTNEYNTADQTTPVELIPNVMDGLLFYSAIGQNVHPVREKTVERSLWLAVISETKTNQAWRRRVWLSESAIISCP